MNNTGQTGGTPDADTDAPEAWGMHRDSSDVVIALIDTGVAHNYPDLDDGTKRNIWTNNTELNGTPGIDDDGNGYVDHVRGWDFVGEDNDPMGSHYYQFDGTSMAAPHVSGLAGLILARSPITTLNELKDRILNGVDTVASLNGRVLTNRRINTYKSLGIPVGPTNLTAMEASSSQIDLNCIDHSDPVLNEDGFRIERKTGASGSYVAIATVGQDMTTYSDVLGEQNTINYYRGRAYNSLGNSSYSNEATPLLVVGDDGGDCFIATAAFGSPPEPHIRVLRDLRDRYLLTNSIVNAFVALYDKLSPPIADFIAKTRC